MKNKKFKKFTVADRKKYHHSRSLKPEKYGLAFGELKHRYSQGFTDGCNNINSNEYTLSILAGDRDAFAYAKGYQSGKKYRNK